MLFGSSRSDETEMTCKSKLEFKVEVLLCTASSDLMTVQLMYTVFQKNPCDYVFDDNLNSKRPILLIFGTVIT